MSNVEITVEALEYPLKIDTMVLSEEELKEIDVLSELVEISESERQYYSSLYPPIMIQIDSLPRLNYEEFEKVELQD